MTFCSSNRARKGEEKPRGYRPALQSEPAKESCTLCPALHWLAVGAEKMEFAKIQFLHTRFDFRAVADNDPD